MIRPAGFLASQVCRWVQSLVYDLPLTHGLAIHERLKYASGIGVALHSEGVPSHNQAAQPGKLPHCIDELSFVLHLIKGEVQLLQVLEHSSLSFDKELLIPTGSKALVTRFTYSFGVSGDADSCSWLWDHNVLDHFTILSSYIVVFLFSQLDVVLRQILTVKLLELIS